MILVSPWNDIILFVGCVAHRSIRAVIPGDLFPRASCISLRGILLIRVARFKVVALFRHSPASSTWPLVVFHGLYDREPSSYGDATPFSLPSHRTLCVYRVTQRSQEVSRVRPRAKWAEHPAASADTPILRTAENITYVWKVSLGNTVARSELSSRSATPTAAVPAKTPKTSLDGKSIFPFYCNYLLYDYFFYYS